MAVANGSFEEAGAALGAASGWTSTFVSSLEEWADFIQNPDTGITRSQEGLEEGWTESTQAFVAAFVGETIDTEAVIFNVGPGQTPVERFERAWGSAGMSFLGDFSASEPAAFSGLDEERFETGWGAVELVLPSSAVTASFDGEDFEDFEEHWGTATAFTLVSAVFAGGVTREDFEEIGLEAISVDISADAVELDLTPAVPLLDDLRVRFEGGSLPNGITAGVWYFLVNVSGKEFQISTTLAGAPLDIVSGGSGDHYAARSGWSAFMSTV